MSNLGAPLGESTCRAPEPSLITERELEAAPPQHPLKATVRVGEKRREMIGGGHGLQQRCGSVCTRYDTRRLTAARRSLFNEGKFVFNQFPKIAGMK